MRIGDRIKELRTTYGVTQVQLAEKAGISRSVISQYESNLVEPTATVVAKLAEALNTSTDYLLGLEDEFRIPVFTLEEKAAGISATKKISITPIEEDMLDVFRKVGKTRGESAQRAIIEMVEKML